MTVIPVLLGLGGLWLVAGALFGVAFLARGAGKVVPAASGSSWGARLLLLPGCAIFWPWLAWLWARGRSAPIECTNHRCEVEG